MAQQLYDASGRALTDDQIRAYYEALANEDRNRYDTDNTYRYASLSSQDRDRKAARQQAKDRLAEEQRQYDQTYAQKAHEFDVNTGTDLLKTGAQMRGPLDYFQGDSFARGSQGYSSWLNSLRNGTSVAYGGGTATQGNPTPLTVSTLANAMSGGSSGSGSSGSSGTTSGNTASGSSVGTDQYGRATLSSDAQSHLDAISQTAQKGLSNLGLGSLENLTDDERKAFRSGLDYLGRSSNDELTMYARSRPGQRGGSLA